ncbi:hypothetical protein ACFX19_013393 [Malus domestica]
MARNLENSASENSNIQEMGLRRSVRQNVTIREATSSPRVSTMGTTVVATLVATHGEVHGAFTTGHHGNHRGGYFGSHSWRGPWSLHHGPSHAIQGSRNQDHDPSRAIQVYVDPSPSLAFTCTAH